MRIDSSPYCWYNYALIIELKNLEWIMRLSETEQQALIDYRSETKNHSLEVLRDDGLYRHLKFSESGSNIYRFDLVTWPGYLTICGDMGTYTFSRDPDMFIFFRDETGGDDPRISPSYWAEKLEGVDRASSVTQFNPELMREAITDDLKDLEFDSEAQRKELWQQIEDEIFDKDLHGDKGMMLSRAIEFHGGEGFESLFSEIYEYNFDEFTFHFLWVLNAIVDGIRRYDEFKSLEEQAAQYVPVEWTPTQAIHDLNAKMNLLELEETGLIVEGKCEFIKLFQKEGPLFEPLMDMMREGRKHKVSVTPRDRSFFEDNRVRNGFMSAFSLTEEQAVEAMINLNWANTDKFERGQFPEGFADYLIPIEEGCLVHSDYGAIVLYECPTSKSWVYRIMPASVILTNNGSGKQTAPHAFYNHGIMPELGSVEENGYASKADALAGAYKAIDVRQQYEDQSEGY